MKYTKIVDIIRGKSIEIPIYIYKLLPKLNIELDTFIFLMYLNGKSNSLLFDVNLFSNELSIDIKTIMKYIKELQEKKLIELKIIPNDKNIIEEYISLDFFYEKISLLLIEDLNDKEEKESNVFEMLEKELAKQLSPIEIEIVKAWKENGYSDEVIKEAIKEAVLNGVANLRYIDKILYEWSKKGIKNKKDVENSKKSFNEKKEQQKIDVFEYDWMDDDNE